MSNEFGESLTEDIAALCIASAAAPEELPELIAGQTSILRAMVIAAGAAATMDTELRWKFYAQLVALERELATR